MAKMISITHMSLTIAALGLLAFTFGILAELKKPDSGFIVVSRNGVVRCKYPSDPSLVFGFLAIVLLLASTAIGCYSPFYAYDGIHVPPKALSSTSTMVAFFLVALWVSIMAQVMLLWTTLSELNHIKSSRIVELPMDNNGLLSSSCPTAKTGLFGGGAFLALNASLFWLLCLMLAKNAREDYFHLQNYLIVGEYEEAKEHDAIQSLS